MCRRRILLLLLCRYPLLHHAALGDVQQLALRLQVKCELPAAGITAIYGPSGSGKSTLLDCIAGLRNPGTDSVIRLGASVWQEREQATPAWKRGIGYVFQDARLFPHLDTRQNLDYAIARRKRPGSLSLQQVVRRLRLDELLSQRAATLSAGQRQRVAIGRALLTNPRLFMRVKAEESGPPPPLSLPSCQEL